MTHTIASRRALDDVADFIVAPTMPWDALICTSRAVHTAVSIVLKSVEEDLRNRLGATRFTRPLLPIIPLGIHTSQFSRREPDRMRWRRKLGIGDDVIAVLFLGRLSVHSKAAPFQLAQAIECATRAEGRRYALIWAGPFSNDFQRKVFMETAKAMAPTVPFLHVDALDPEIGSIWAAADIFCSLSDNVQESFGLAIVEAMAAGLPVVASNWDGYRDTVEHGVTGILVDSYMPPVSLADAAYRYMNGEDSYDRYIGGLSQFCMVDVAETARWIARLGAEPAAAPHARRRCKARGPQQFRLDGRAAAVSRALGGTKGSPPARARRRAPEAIDDMAILRSRRQLCRVPFAPYSAGHVDRVRPALPIMGSDCRDARRCAQSIRPVAGVAIAGATGDLCGRRYNDGGGIGWRLFCAPAAPRAALAPLADQGRSAEHCP